MRFDEQRVDAATLERMSELIAHRGPDDVGTYVDGPIGLAHRRLSIIDLSPAGRQPMANDNESLWLVFNGEIYNYLELRRTLEAEGFVFRSQTDTEVILHAYACWGEACVTRMRGMWAFVIWDEQKKRLFCSRDRLGIKPFYYFCGSRLFSFASEIKAFAPLEEIPFEADSRVIYRLIVHGISDCDESTSFESIRQLRPAHCLSVGLDGATRNWQYWAPQPAENSNVADDGEYATEFRTRLTESIHEHLQSDVPVGACLSGGLDSCAIVSIIASEQSPQLPTFTVEYSSKDYNEGPFVSAMRSAFPRLQMHSSTPDGRDALDVLQQVVWHYDEPVWAPTTYSWWKVMQLVQQQGIKVIVNGQGADELLAGYPRYDITYLRQLEGRGSLLKLWSEAKAVSSRSGTSTYRLLREVVTPFVPRSLRNAKRATGQKTHVDDSMFSPEFRQSVSDDVKPKRAVFWNLQEHLLSDLSATRLPTLLHAEDRFSMAFSIESRVPFLDHRLVEFAISLPVSQKLTGSTTKVVLRRAMQGMLPHKILNRKDKKGYPTLAGEWLKSQAAESARDLLGSRSFQDRGIFDPKRVMQRLNKLDGAHRQDAEEIYRWLGMELWFRQFIDERPQPKLRSAGSLS